ncbi:MAG: hypothetical protein MJ197_06510 [Bacteroidales bacterium]|nr:hypothetical protein [Bacteroidales bacterium]
MDLTKENLVGICNIISATLKQESSFDTKIHVLKGLLKDVDYTSACPKIYRTVNGMEEMIFPPENYNSNLFKDMNPSFFYQDYESLSDKQLGDYKVTKEGLGPYFFEPILAVTDCLEKRFIMVFAVLYDEIERLKQQKKCIWKGKVHEEQTELSFEITKEQEQEILKIFNDYKVGADKSGFELIGIVKTCDLSCLYTYKCEGGKPSDIVRVHSVIVAIDKILGRTWGRNAAYATTKVLADGPRTFEQIQKNYRSSDNF